MLQNFDILNKPPIYHNTDSNKKVIVPTNVRTIKLFLKNLILRMADRQMIPRWQVPVLVGMAMWLPKVQRLLRERQLQAADHE